MLLSVGCWIPCEQSTMSAYYAHLFIETAAAENFANSQATTTIILKNHYCITLNNFSSISPSDVSNPFLTEVKLLEIQRSICVNILSACKLTCTFLE